MAKVEKESVGDRSVTLDVEVDVSAAEGSRVEGVFPCQLCAQAHENQWKLVLKAVVSISLVSLGGIFIYPPITSAESKPRGFMSHTLHFLAFVSLAIGFLGPPLS